MATQYSDIYIDGITTEELYAENRRIVEAWLDGECIWRLIEGLKKAKHIVIWTRLNNKYYGFGLYLTSDTPPYDNWQRIFFSGINAKEMIFNLVETGNTDDAFSDGFSRFSPVSVYDFGFCVFKGLYQPAAAFPNVSVILGLDVHSTAGKNTAELADVLEESYVNISDPMGMCSNVFNNRYQIRGSNHYEYVDGKLTYGFAEIYDMKNKNVMYAYPNGEDNTLAYKTGMCAKMSNIVYFVPWDNTARGLYTLKNIPLYYIDINNLYVVEKTEINIQKYLAPDVNSKAGYSIYHVRGTGIDSDNKKIVFGLQIRLISLETQTENNYKNILVKYENGTLTTAEQQVDLWNRGCKIIGSYIVLMVVNSYTANAATFLAGKSIDNMTSFLYYPPENNYGRPHCFYEENEKLYYDEIYTRELLSSQEPVSSVVRKNRVDFELGKIVMESETEINGKWED